MALGVKKKVTSLRDTLSLAQGGVLVGRVELVDGMDAGFTLPKLVRPAKQG